tara:strand:- start:3545 stop:5791 length:2247 start_codon:yes stop_codon:yes gene_type:complete
MGIEKFFNSLKNDYNIIKKIIPNSYSILKTKYFFIDFNSIIHIIGNRITSLINFTIFEAINGNLINKYLKILDLKYDILKDCKSDNDIYSKFKQKLTEDNLNNLVIKYISLYIQNLLKKFNGIQFIYLSIDGVPTKAKIVEQKKRRYMGEFSEKIKKEIIEKHKKLLDHQNDKKYNLYNYFKNNIVYSKSNISPGTSFMFKLSKFLNSDDFKNDLVAICPELTKNNILISDHLSEDEGEKKIIDYIDNPKYDIKGDISIYSPDADLILLTLILKNKNVKRHVLRIDQQVNVDITKITDAYYDDTDIDLLEKQIYDYLNTPLKSDIVIRDLVFIFTFFGDDFLPKIESIDVKKDINLILNFYKKYLLKTNNKSILEDNKIVNINYENFLTLLNLISENEEDLVGRNYFSKKYKNYNYLQDEINIKLASKKYKYHFVDHKNILKFINDYNNKVQNMPDLSMKFIKLHQYPYTVNDNKFKKTIENMNKYELEVFKFDNILDEYYEKFNKKYDLPLGNPKYNYIEGKNKFYNDFFKTNKISNILYSYIQGIVWVTDYYFNDISYKKWFFKYEKAPLITDILIYLKKNKDILKNVRNNLNKFNVSQENELKPIEHFLYITPFDKENSQLKFIKDYPPEIFKKCQKFIESIKNDSYFKNLYPNIHSISKKLLYTNKKNTFDVDCRMVLFLNKCILKVVESSNLIDEIKFSNKFRYIVMKNVNIQNKRKYKKLYHATRNIKYKIKYKYIKYYLTI